MRLISLKAVAIAAIFDVVVSNFVGLAVFFAFAAASGNSTFNADGMRQLAKSPEVWAIGLLGGGIVSVLAGYLAALIARKGALLNGALSSSLCVVLGLYVILSGRSPEHLTRQILELPMSPLLGLLGGFLFAARRRAG
jgi:hypothetical protein